MKLEERPTHHSYAHTHTPHLVVAAEDTRIVVCLFCVALPLPTKFRFFLTLVDWRIALTIASTFSS